MNNLNTFINNWKELNLTKCGLEFEFLSNYDYVKTLEILNNYFNPIEVYGFNTYHSDFIVSNTQFKIEPDFSGGSDMIELITGPMEYNEAKIIISKMLEFIKKHGYTNETSSIHINISFDDINMKDLKPVKLILNLNEDFIYEKFPDRMNNIYARSIKYIIPFEHYINTQYGMSSVINSFTIPDDSKYYGVNFLKLSENYLEFRYIGGENYEDKKIEIFTMLDYFILQCRNAILEDYNQNDFIKLESYLDDNISWYKKYATYEDFLTNIENINIEVDKNTEYKNIVIYWEQFRIKLFELIKYSDSISKCTINFNTHTKRLEVLDANIESLILVSNIDFIECKIIDSNINRSDLVECDVTNSHIYNSNIYDSKIQNSKTTNVKASEYTVLDNCVFDGGVLDCIMTDGVFRSGTIGPDADIDNTVKMANYSEFWMISNAGNKKTNTKKI